jgi:prephenate dehydratase
MSSSARPEGVPTHPRVRVGHLGPAGTFSEEALLAGALPDAVRPVGLETIFDTVSALVRGEVDWAVVPIENSLDGSVTVTLDLLADHATEIEIVAEQLLAVRHFLVAAAEMPIEAIRSVLTHPQVPGQCRRFLREQLPGAQVGPANSTADAVRLAAAADPAERIAAIGPRLAADIYGGSVLREDVQDRGDNLTRFVWLGRLGGAPGAAPVRLAPQAPRKTSLVFWGAGADRSGWLVLCLDQFGRRGINLTKIESRPRRERMGHYMFFVDLEGDARERGVAEAIAGLRELCEQVCVLGSYPAAEGP